MQKFIALAVMVLGMTMVAAAQDVPQAEVFGGYSLFHFDDQGLEADLQTLDPTASLNRNLHGWEGGVQFNVTKMFGVVADFSGHYGTVAESSGGSVSGNIYNFLFGPQVNFRGEKASAFVHALFGGNRFKINAIPAPVSSPDVSDTAFAMALGGGVDVNVSKRVAVRLGQFDYIFTNHTFSQFGLDLPHQNNLRFSAGLVLKLGEKQ